MSTTRRRARPALFACVLSLIATPAFADDDWEAQRENERIRGEFTELGKRLVTEAAGPGLETAKVQAPPWCADTTVDGRPSPSSIARTIESSDDYFNYWPALLDAATSTCAYPKEASIQKAVQIIQQKWINLTGLSAAQALETFKLRLHKDTLDADKTKLCDALKVSDEVDGAEKAFMTARRELLCVPMWADDNHVPDDLMTFLDSTDDVPEDVRLALVLDHTRVTLRGTPTDNDLLAYAYDQIDYKAFSADKALKLLDAAPYKGNTYARAVILESIGRARMGLAAMDGIIAKKTSDADWKELLVTAPQRGAAAWQKEAAKYKDQLARSNQFENKFWGPSRKALKGCWSQLRTDFLDVAKTLGKATPTEFKDALSDPIASLLFSRLAACAAVDQDSAYANRLLAISRDVRYARGPRVAAYYAALEALGAILEDRTKFPVNPQYFRIDTRSALYDAALRVPDNDKSKIDSMGFVGDSGASIVKAVKKVGDKVQVTFVTEKHQEMSQSCVDTNKIHSIASDGRIIYYQRCKDTGWVTIDDTTGGITVPADWADGIKKGAMVEFESARGQPPGRMALPTAVYADKSKKKLVNWYGFGL